MQAFRVTKGVRVEVRMVHHNHAWRTHVTTKDCEFSEPIGRSRTLVVFRQGRWLMRVRIRDVKCFNGYRWVAME